MHPRIAFTAEFWNSRAVVCRVVENRIGASVMQEFGLFDTWTEANQFANKLNEGLGLGQEEAREIVTAAQLAVIDHLSVAVRKDSFWDRAPVISRANSLQVRFLFAHLQLARTFCQLARCNEADSRSASLVGRAMQALDSALAFLPRLRVRQAEIEELHMQFESLKAELRGLMLSGIEM